MLYTKIHKIHSSGFRGLGFKGFFCVGLCRACRSCTKKGYGPSDLRVLLEIRKVSQGLQLRGAIWDCQCRPSGVKDLYFRI